MKSPLDPDDGEDYEDGAPVPQADRPPSYRNFTIYEAMTDPDLFGNTFDSPTWDGWKAIAKLIDADPNNPLDERERRYCEELTGRTDLSGPFEEIWLLCGRRAGKSYFLSLLCICWALLRDWRGYVSADKPALAMLLAADKEQAGVMFAFVLGLITSSPTLAKEIDGKPTAESIKLSNGVTITVSASNYKTVRGRTIVCALMDEVAFWPTDEESANRDVDTVNATRPGLLSAPGSILLGGTTTYAKKGFIWEMHKKHYGKNDSDVLVIQAPTRKLNPTIGQKKINRAIAEDPDAAKTEYLAEFRSDISGYITEEAVKAVIMPGAIELPPRPGARYQAFADAASGLGKDSFAFAISHSENGIAVLDAVREFRPPFDPKSVVVEVATLAKAYGVHKVTGDRWATGFVDAEFRTNGISYEVTDKTASDIYREILPHLNSGRVKLLDNKRLTYQLCALERRVNRGSGKDQITHPTGGHDDLANAACGALVGMVTNATMATWAKLAGIDQAGYVPPSPTDLNATRDEANKRAVERSKATGGEQERKRQEMATQCRWIVVERIKQNWEFYGRTPAQEFVKLMRDYRFPATEADYEENGQ